MSAPDRIFCMQELHTYLLETPARLHAEDLAKALREIRDTPCMDPEGNSQIAAIALAKLEGNT